MKNLFKCNLQLAKALNKKLFLLRCRKQRVFPKNRRLKNVNNINAVVFNRIEKKFIWAVINQEIAEVFLKIVKLNKLIHIHKQHIKEVISKYYFKNFVTRLENSFNLRYEYIKAVHIRKFNNIISDLETNNLTGVDDIGSSIDLDGENSKWLVNTTNTEIPVKVNNILGLGEKFCPPICGRSTPFVNIVASIEGTLLQNSDDNLILDKPMLRNEIVNILTNFKNRIRHNQHMTVEEKRFISDVSHTKVFLKEHPEILVTRADKGNTTVVVNKTDYFEKITAMLDDENTYECIDKENTDAIQRKLNLMITSWQKENKLSVHEGKLLRSHHGVVAKLYGLPKIHKVNTPYRPIVSSIGTPLYQLSAFLSRILNKTVGQSPTAVKNSVVFKEKIRDIRLPNDYVILSLDVVSLFTNIDSDLALRLINERWNEIKRNSGTNLTKYQYINAMDLVLRNCEFSFNNKIYRQLFGSPMGSPTSPAIADLVMEFVETSVLDSLDFKPVFFYRYVDDIVTAIPSDKVNIFFETFNAFNNNIKFTMELEHNDKLAFLDLMIIHNDDGTLMTDWFHKTTWSGRYLNYNSNLPLSYKRNTVKLLSQKILQLSDTIFHKDNFRLLKKTLLENGYPNSFMNQIINSVIYQNSNTNNQSVEVVPLVDQNNKKYVSIPYVKSLHEKLRYCLGKHNLELVGKAFNSFGKTLFSALKCPTHLSDNTNVVYEIKCECEKTYIGQTQQKLKTRFYQHKRDAQKLHLKKVSKDAASALSNHLYDTNHSVFLENVRILEKEPNHYTRRVLEMLHIKMNADTLNKQSDCVYLQNTYNHLVQRHS